jgi:pyruvate/2-oxoglutarate dehydrogenase complex dihydrolipoamide dehydrogenase (E3) component
MNLADYDLVVIGSGPAGQKGAIAAAKAGRRVALVDRAVMMGGVSVHAGAIPSKTLREAIFQLTGSTVKALYGKRQRDIFNYPTLAEAYKVAALDGLNKLWEVDVRGAGETEVLHDHFTEELARK